MASKRPTAAEYHDQLVEFGMEQYRSAAVETMAFLAEGGRLPGVEQADPAEIRGFFEQTTPEMWLNLAQQDPQQAVKALRDFVEVA